MKNEAKIADLMTPSRWDEFPLTTEPRKFRKTKFSMDLARAAMRSPNGAEKNNIKAMFAHRSDDTAVVTVRRSNLGYGKTNNIAYELRVPDSENEILKAMNELILQAVDPIHSKIETLLNRIRSLSPGDKSAAKNWAEHNNIPTDFSKLTADIVDAWNHKLDEIQAGE